MLKGGIVKRKLALVGLCLIIAVGASVGTYLYSEARHKKALLKEGLASAFYQRYGTASQLVRIAKVDEVYMYYWVDNGQSRAAMYVDGIWLAINLNIQQGEK